MIIEIRNAWTKRQSGRLPRQAFVIYKCLEAGSKDIYVFFEFMPKRWKDGWQYYHPKEGWLYAYTRGMV
jgi:hypothetical protein